ncbi:YlbG family protein [Lentibacillus sp. CBA3610]|uniref:YlbG family protein n=1 Tax=Lentibacillus sp. CBA3610 TaxID=2518176 RepID=UPI0015957086|nr:DUF2129 domain-containing protein [Lentibacillus sp. CBA3610]QKY68940.1 DUF2129 domain-containing protein [Lentibacillus sp. CBA3610]
MRPKRQGLIVWFQHMKNVRHIKRYGHLIYSSKKLKYAVIYVDQENLDSVESKLLKLPFVSKVDRSYKPFLQTDFENPQPDKAKQYDYKIGI